MKFYAIAYKFQEDIFYNLVSGEETHELNEQCLLPCETLAAQVINDELNSDFVPVEITLETLTKDGVYSWHRGEVADWDS